MSRRAYPDSSIHPSDDADRARHTSSAYCGRQSLGLESDDQWGYEELKHCPGLRPLPRILSARIPFEVMETIIDSGEETSLLCACALVCRSWNRYSTKKLYRSITITSRTELERLSASARQFPEVRERLTETRCIVLRNSAQAFPLILGRYLPNVKRLVFGEWCMSLPIHPSFFFVLSQLASVTALTLYGFELCDFSELRSILSKFPLLTDLSISYITFKRCPVDSGPTLPDVVRAAASPGPALRAQLQSLQLTSLCATILYRLVGWLTSCDATCRSVSKLWIAPHGPMEGVHRIQQLLRITGTSLTHCQLELRLEGEHKVPAHRRTEMTYLVVGSHTRPPSQS